MAVQADHEIHVLADRVRPVPTEIQNALAREHAEGAGDDRQGVEGSPSHPTEQERPEILDDLKTQKRLPRQRDIVDALKRQARLEDTSRWDVIDFP